MVGWAGTASIADYPRTVSEPEVPHFYPDRGGRDGDARRPDRRRPDRRRRRGGGARHGAPAALDVHARERMQEARDVIEALVAEGAVVYGVTTGFGDLATTVRSPPADAARLQENLLMSHAAGVGPAVPARGRAGDAAAPREHAGARALRLPAARRRPAARLPRAAASTRSCRSRGASAPRATSRRSRTSRCR